MYQMMVGYFPFGIKLGQRSVVRVHSFCFILDSNEQGIDNDPFFRFLFGISLTLLIVSLLVLSQLGHMHGKQVLTGILDWFYRINSTDFPESSQFLS